MAKKNIEISDGAAIPTEEDKGLVTAWQVVFTGTVILLIFFCVFKPHPYLDILRFMSDGIVVTFKLTLICMGLSFIVGLFTGIGRISQNKFINLLASIYVEVIRGIPLLVQLFYIYYAVGSFVKVSPFISAVIALTICYGAYMGEVFRAGIESIDKGQIEAALSLGFNKRQTMFYVVLPQAMRTILPPVGNEFIALLKDTSLVSIIAVADLFRRAREYATATFNYFETFTMVALVYLLITLILSKFVGYMEKKLTPYK